MSNFNPINLLTNNLKLINNKNYINMNDNILSYYEPLPPNRLIEFYGDYDSGKTTIALDIIINNPSKSFIYINSFLDNFKLLKDVNNCFIYISNIYEDILLFLNSLEPNLIDFIIIDDIYNLISKHELSSYFNSNINNKDIFQNFIKQLSLIAVKHKFNIILFNSLNIINNKSKYSYILEKETILTFRIEKQSITLDYLLLKIIPEKNLINNNKLSKTIKFIFTNKED